jgi:hypothetical protein
VRDCLPTATLEPSESICGERPYPGRIICPGRACSACADSSSEHELFPPPANSVPCFSRCSTRARDRIGPPAEDLHLLHMGPKVACFLNTHKVSNSVLGSCHGRIRLPSDEPQFRLLMCKIDCSFLKVSVILTALHTSSHLLGVILLENLRSLPNLARPAMPALAAGHL